MADFGAPLRAMGVSPGDFERPDVVIQIGRAPNRIDLLTGISGVADFESAWADRTIRPIRGHDLPFLGRETLIANKRATGRTKDLADLEALGEGGGG